MQSIGRMFSNPILLPAFSAWFLAQFIKVIYHWIIDKKLNWGWFFATGGMPSSHSSFVMALITIAGFLEGFDSLLFGVSSVFAFVVMYDAMGVRRAAGEQAMAINKILHEIRTGSNIDFTPMREILGHRPIEVMLGALLGIIVAIIYILIRYV